MESPFRELAAQAWQHASIAVSVLARPGIYPAVWDAVAGKEGANARRHSQSQHEKLSSNTVGMGVNQTIRLAQMVPGSW